MRLSVFAFALVVVPTLTRAAEEPEHEVLRKLDNNIEIRQYLPYVVAEVLGLIAGILLGTATPPYPSLRLAARVHA